MTHTIGMISLGCAKNQVNAEHMLWLLRQGAMRSAQTPTVRNSSLSTPAASLNPQRQKPSTTSLLWRS